MSTKPIFVATHPRACSTAFERVFMTRDKTMTCIHEPFGDAFYFGPERLGMRYESSKKMRQASGFAESTYKTVLDRIESEGREGKRTFIKDITHYLVPANSQPTSIAPSVGGATVKKGVGTDGVQTPAPIGTSRKYSNGTDKKSTPYSTHPEPGNPTVLPNEVLKQFHFTFLIRHPRYSIPSYYRCTIPPLDDITGFYNFMPSEAGYDELRRVFDYLREQEIVGPSVAGQHGKLKDGEVSITVIDADDLLDNPAGIIKAYCAEVGIEYTPDMLVWDSEESHTRAKIAFEKWRGFHEDAIASTSLKPRSQAHKKKDKPVDIEDREWRERYGEEGQKVIRECVDANIADYEYLKSFAIQV